MMLLFGVLRPSWVLRYFSRAVEYVAIYAMAGIIRNEVFFSMYELEREGEVKCFKTKQHFNKNKDK